MTTLQTKQTYPVSLTFSKIAEEEWKEADRVQV